MESMAMSVADALRPLPTRTAPTWSPPIAALLDRVFARSADGGAG
jgi:hypothetical protein